MLLLNVLGTGAGKGSNKGGKNKPVVQPKPAVSVKLKSIADQEFTPARLQKLTYGKISTLKVNALEI